MSANVTLKLNEPQIINKVTNPRFGLFVAQTWKTLIDPYTPRREGFLIGEKGQTIEITPFAIKYLTKYAAVNYYNRRNFRQNLSPFATDHWDKSAENAGQKTKLYRAIKNYQNKIGE